MELPETTSTKSVFFEKFIPVITTICCITGVVLFIGINIEPDTNNWDVYKKWGAPSETEIFNGSYWGLFTSNFLHTQIWHIVFNLYWLWIFGKKIEFENSKLFYAFLIYSSALVSSLSELSFDNTTGIGLSGICYSLFGFIFIKGKQAGVYKGYLSTKVTRLFFIWLVVCIVLTKMKVWNIGNAAHVGGLLWGMMLAYTSPWPGYKQWAIAATVLFVLASSVVWSPWSTGWLSNRAYHLHKEQKLDEAILIYKKILQRDPDNIFAKTNLKQVEIYQLQNKALDLEKSQQYELAITVYEKIVQLDTANEFGKTNLRRLQLYQLQKEAAKLHTERKYKEARAVYREKLSVDPGEEWAKDNMSRLPE